MKPIFKKLVFVLVLILLSGVVHQTQDRLDQGHQVRFVDRSVVFLPNGNVLKALSMGYRGLMADWLWIRTVIYFGRRVIDEDNPYFLYEIFDGNPDKVDEARTHHEVFHSDGDRAHTEDGEHGQFDRELSEKTQVFLESIDHSVDPPPEPPDSIQVLDEKLIKLLYRFESRGLVEGVYPLLDRVTTVDPHFIKPYIFGGVYVLLETGRIKQATALLEKGYKNNPDRWDFPFYLGWIHWIYIGDLKKTLEYLKIAVGKPDCPAYVYNLLGGLSRDMNQTQMTQLYLEGLYNSADDPENREQIGKLLQTLNQPE